MFVEVITSIETRQLNRTFTYGVPAELSGEIRVGSAVKIPFGRGNKLIRAYVVAVEDTVPESLRGKLKDIHEVETQCTDINGGMLKLASLVAEAFFLPIAAVLRLMVIKTGRIRRGSGGKLIRLTATGQEALPRMRKSRKKELMSRIEGAGLLYEELIEEGYPRESVLELLRLGLAQEESLQQPIETITLSQAQSLVLEVIQKSMESQEEKKPILLFGATGSGKTEIYFRAIRSCLEAGGQALVLLPEISLTQQMLARYEKAFPGNVAIWHSQISPAGKQRAWEALQSGEKNILIGARSAVFAPMGKTGLIIIDEEHDTSYIQETMPVYNARDAALIRGKVEACQVIMGSATPSLESLEAAREGLYQLVSLKEKYYGQEEPEVSLVDMAMELRSGNRSILSEALRQEMEKVLARGEQVLLFLNRRGSYNFLLCRDCGHVPQCPHCAIPLSYHEKELSMLCHYCGWKEERPVSCPSCGSERIRGVGTGTQQAARVVEGFFPKYPVARLDGDVPGGVRSRHEILEGFRRQDYRILIGTQMVAKGIDFPNVGLIGILLGDMTLNFPDYRSRERTFQLLMQVIGRTGRRGKKGRVLLQTYRPGDIIYKDVINHDSDAFYIREAAYRKAHDYPPFGEILRIQLAAEERKDVQEAAWSIHESLSDFLQAGEVYRPKAAYVEHHAGLFRWSVTIRIRKERFAEIEKGLRSLLRAFEGELRGKARMYVERNPSGML